MLFYTGIYGGGGGGDFVQYDCMEVYSLQWCLWLSMVLFSLGAGMFAVAWHSEKAKRIIMVTSKKRYHTDWNRKSTSTILSC